MRDEAVLRVIWEICKRQGVVGLSDITSVPGVGGSIQARRCLDNAVERGLLQPARGGGFVIPMESAR